MTPRVERFAITGGKANLSVSLSAGTIRLTEAVDDQVTVTIEGRDPSMLEITALGDDITIGQRESEKRLFGLSGRFTVGLQVPEGSDLRVSSASCDVISDVTLGEVRFKTASGDARLNSLIGSLEVKSASGDVRVDDVGGSVKASLASGDVRLGDVSGPLDVNTASGDLFVETVSGDVSVRTASGDIRISRWAGHDLKVKTISGDTTVTVPAGTRAELNLRSLSGDIHMPTVPHESGDSVERVRRRLSFNSVSGDFHLGVE